MSVVLASVIIYHRATHLLRWCTTAPSFTVRRRHLFGHIPWRHHYMLFRFIMASLPSGGIDNLLLCTDSYKVKQPFNSFSILVTDTWTYILFNDLRLEKCWVVNLVKTAFYFEWRPMEGMSVTHKVCIGQPLFGPLQQGVSILLLAVEWLVHRGVLLN